MIGLPACHRPLRRRRRGYLINYDFDAGTPLAERVVPTDRELQIIKESLNLLHEATHIIDYVNRYTPYVEPNMLELQGRSSRETPFTNQLATVSSKNRNLHYRA